MVDSKSLICTNHHCFDVARQGYVNWLSFSPKGNYDKQIFESRRIVVNSGFFEPLLDRISERITGARAAKAKPIKLIDAGCGEGSLLSRIGEKMAPRDVHDFLTGVDISKEGISSAAAAYNNLVWCVADIAKLPFASKQFDFILNILSPSNYSEFQRILSDDGMVIKVIPDRDYLQELRAVFYEGTNRRVYSNANTLDRFVHHFHLFKTERVNYKVVLEQRLIQALIRMTPLSWGTTQDRLQHAMKMDGAEITIDLTILYGTKKQPE